MNGIWALKFDQWAPIQSAKSANEIKSSLREGETTKRQRERVSEKNKGDRINGEWIGCFQWTKFPTNSGRPLSGRHHTHRPGRLQPELYHWTNLQEWTGASPSGRFNVSSSSRPPPTLRPRPRPRPRPIHPLPSTRSKTLSSRSGMTRTTPRTIPRMLLISVIIIILLGISLTPVPLPRRLSARAARRPLMHLLPISPSIPTSTRISLKTS